MYACSLGMRESNNRTCNIVKAIMSMRVAEVAAYGEKRSCIAYEYVETMEARGLHVVLVPNNTVSVQRYMQGDDIGLVVLTGVIGGTHRDARTDEQWSEEKHIVDRLVPDREGRQDCAGKNPMTLHLMLRLQTTVFR